MPALSAKSQRRRWIASGILAVLVLVALASFRLVLYLNQSTPDKTLDAFCHALLQADYRSAYNQFSAILQRTIPEDAFAVPLSQDRVMACTHSSAGTFGIQSALSQLTLVHTSHGKNTDIVSLVKDVHNDWKIDDISRASPAVP
jgi:hypothetical protein